MMKKHTKLIDRLLILALSMSLSTPGVSRITIVINQPLDFGIIGPTTGESTDIGSIYSVLSGGGTSTTGGGIFFGGEQRGQFTVNVTSFRDFPLSIQINGGIDIRPYIAEGKPRFTLISQSGMNCTIKLETDTLVRWCCADTAGGSVTRSASFWVGSLDTLLNTIWTPGTYSTTVRIIARKDTNQCP